MAKATKTTNSDCVLSARGYGSRSVPVIDISFGPTFIATQDEGRDNRIFYPRQVQLDMFSVTVVFGLLSDRNDFNHWLWGYAHYASAPVHKTVSPMRVTVSSRQFDMVGIPTSGWSYNHAPVTLEDVIWPVTIGFDGASPVNAEVWAAQESWFVPPAMAAQGQLQQFYPNQFYGPGNPGGGPPSAEAYLYDMPTGLHLPPKPVQLTRGAGRASLRP